MKLGLYTWPGAGDKTNLGLATVKTVASLARPIAPLTLNTSIPRAIETLRQSNLDRYPIVNGNHLVLMLSEADLATALLSIPMEKRDGYRLQPLSVILNVVLQSDHDAPVLSAGEPLSTVELLFEKYPAISTFAVVDGRARYFGILNRNDLLAGIYKTLAPARVGGMATPLGVYLTDGIESGGVGNLALMLSGISLGLLFVVAVVGTNAISHLALARHVDIEGMFIRLLLPIMPRYAVSFVYGATAIVPVVVMLLLLRLVPIAGYHAAEHQVVHCIERGEPLLPDKVASMPRPHPRCGTNIVAGLSLFGIYFSVGSSLLDTSTALVPAALMTVFTWRPVGTFLQQYITTRTASPSQLASGIAAGEDLLQKFRENTNRRIQWPLRIWRMGLLQIFAGFSLLTGLLWALCLLFPQIQPYFQGIN
jgi:CBS domain-containing protein